MHYHCHAPPNLDACVWEYIYNYRAGRYWNLLSRYIMAKSITVLQLYIMIFYFSQPETNYTIEVIILADTLIATHCMKYIFRL